MNHEIWEGTASQLLSALNDFAEIELKMTISKIRIWPKSPNKLSGSLKEVKTNLREKGIVIEKYKDKKGNKIIKIHNLSYESSNRQNSEIQTQNPTNNFDDTTSSIVKESTQESVNNQAQDCAFDDNDGKDDTLGTNVGLSSNNELYECYYCEKFSPTNNKLSYEKHVLNIHHKKRAYPFLSELKEMGIAPKGKSWEQQRIRK